ncbi:hypothetical protein AK830_g7471 [Neonectria ditissima]|uniref:NADH:ubiquinone oxidoreductase intermediate-associated protein 30 domain-containing protein n=1 Tax=Neonectria ditissima TaxID=78410 RepID=A0A0P7BES0_9HYPO|nr:hypothetical protein AK830_g7471 [Neonectria ditissima]
MRPTPFLVSKGILGRTMTFEAIKGASGPRPLYDFNAPAPVRDCIVMSDRAIGGYSESHFEYTTAGETKQPSEPSPSPSHTPTSFARFHGTISTRLPTNHPNIERTGFAGFRTPDQRPTLFGRSLWDIDPYIYLAMRVKSDGRAYFINLQTESVEPSDLHQHRLFSKRPGQWETVLVKWNDFVRTNHGFVIEPQTEMLRQKVMTVGIGLTDRTEGPFELCIERVWATNDSTEGGIADKSDESELRNRKGERIRCPNTSIPSLPPTETSHCATEKGSESEVPANKKHASIQDRDDTPETVSPCDNSVGLNDREGWIDKGHMMIRGHASDEDEDKDERKMENPSRQNTTTRLLDEPQTLPRLGTDQFDGTPIACTDTPPEPDETIPAEYQEWPFQGMVRCITLGNERTFSSEFSLPYGPGGACLQMSAFSSSQVWQAEQSIHQGLTTFGVPRSPLGSLQSRVFARTGEQCRDIFVDPVPETFRLEPAGIVWLVGGYTALLAPLFNGVVEAVLVARGKKSERNIQSLESEGQKEAYDSSSPASRPCLVSWTSAGSEDWQPDDVVSTAVEDSPNPPPPPSSLVEAEENHDDSNSSFIKMLNIIVRRRGHRSFELRYYGFSCLDTAYWLNFGQTVEKSDSTFLHVKSSLVKAQSPLGIPEPPTIRILHPGYSNSSNNPDFDILIAFQAFDDGGVHYDTAHTACAILANNRWDGYFSRDKYGKIKVRPTDGVLRDPSSYFCLPSSDPSTDQYPVIPRFKDWRFPHNNLPPIWMQLKEQLLAEQETKQARPGHCSLSDYANAIEAAHLVPTTQSH